MPTSSASARTRAVMHSTTTTARATTIGSWRPLISMAMFSPSLLIVCWEAATDGVGLKPARTTISLPSLIPPKIPPAWLVSLTMEPSAFTWKASLLVSPVAVQTVSDFHAFYGADGDECFCKVGIELFKHRIADTGRHMVNDTFDHTADGIFFRHGFC